MRKHMTRVRVAVALIVAFSSACGSKGASEGPITPAEIPTLAITATPPPIAEYPRSEDGRVHAKIRTSLGDIDCLLFPDRAPLNVENFVGLARGTKAWQEHASKRWVKRPAYHGSTFHRVIANFMIQGGDPSGTGLGEPGYTVDDELWPGMKHDRAGLLCTANRGPNTNGMQFYILDAAAPHLEGRDTVFGECKNLDVIHKIAKVPTDAGNRPVTPVTIRDVEITGMP
jgi:peptidyl-prolyl cis-trans isomerase A (cyclophilin A)